MKLVERLHEGYVSGRRARILSQHLSNVIPEKLTVLDVGCGDGLLDRLICNLRPDLSLQGLDVLVRPRTFISVIEFDGTTIPYRDASFDCVMFVDVLHHTIDPMKLLREAVRVTRRLIIVKDHAREGFLGAFTLRVMDRIGNQRHGVTLPYNYWTTKQWLGAWGDLDLCVALRITKLRLYPWPATWICDRGLHFVARLEKT